MLDLTAPAISNEAHDVNRKPAADPEVVDIRDSVTSEEIDAQLAARRLPEQIDDPIDAAKARIYDWLDEVAPATGIDAPLEALRTPLSPEAAREAEEVAMADLLERAYKIKGAETAETGSARNVYQRFKAARQGDAENVPKNPTISTLGKKKREELNLGSLQDAKDKAEQSLAAARTVFAGIVQKNRTSIRNAFSNASEVKDTQSEALNNWLEARGKFIEAQAAIKKAEGIDETNATKEILLSTYADDLTALEAAADQDTSVDAKLIKWFSRGESATKSLVSSAVENVKENGVKNGLATTAMKAAGTIKEAVKAADEEKEDIDFSTYVSNNRLVHERNLSTDRRKLRAKVLKGTALAAVATAVIYKVDK